MGSLSSDTGAERERAGGEDRRDQSPSQLAVIRQTQPTKQLAPEKSTN